ncbi:hypothetical protein MPAN_011880 [Mariniplasma anaerobium]|uniref:Uncharacterized protein n=1 Tax=Mariniplasma anaerobium TaxID=2735436 RepID=A0A7U9TH13_9MOLU|nr:hypothetical protein MPAN_011880 [Mariniplasma anaerobium]
MSHIRHFHTGDVCQYEVYYTCCPDPLVRTVGPYETNVRGYENVSTKTWKSLFMS